MRLGGETPFTRTAESGAYWNIEVAKWLPP